MSRRPRKPCLKLSLPPARQESPQLGTLLVTWVSSSEEQSEDRCALEKGFSKSHHCSEQEIPMGKRRFLSHHAPAL